ncbi:hypothetical protein PEC18_18615 [Paucibacter sp. O1-1]|nr:hypothetical protein [Paucibacter sp. O1-1]MDA3827811.1 hypothetical protein [Paucibacter sp. O1-1]
MSSKPINMSGTRYGNLVAVSPLCTKANGNVVWQFICDCGNAAEIDGYQVRSGRIWTCKVCSAQRSRQASVTHGLSTSPEYSVWESMNTRCHNKRATAFADYGGRGITVCQRWRESFAAFISDMGARPTSEHTIERLDVNGNYEPNNCCWITAEKQALNKRSNRLVTIDGTTKPVRAWERQAGLRAGCISQRLDAGESGPGLLRRSTRGGTIELEGVSDTYEGWSKRTGIKASTIAMRITSYGWSVQKALTEGATS